MSTPLQLAFTTSAADVGQLPPTPAEVAVAGRSNVGKSSLLNALTGRKALAKVSSAPGKTRLLNCYTTPDGVTLVDLPGYGYASTGAARTREAWQERFERYLLERENLVRVLLLVDAEIGPTRLDTATLAWLRYYELAFQVVATKLDKVRPSKRERRTRDLATGCELAHSEIIWVSAHTGVGIDRLRDEVRAALSPPARHP